LAVAAEVEDAEVVGHEEDEVGEGGAGGLGVEGGGGGEEGAAGERAHGNRIVEAGRPGCGDRAGE
jgi:hypothetical protein